jgi:hypothetical protein
MARAQVQDIVLLSLLERGDDIVDVRSIAVECDARGVETHPLDARIRLEPISPESLAGSPNSFSLGKTHTAEPCRPGAGAARSHFDDQDHFAAPRDDVDLEPPELQVSIHDRATRTLEVADDRFFGALPEHGARRDRAGHRVTLIVVQAADGGEWIRGSSACQVLPLLILVV